MLFYFRLLINKLVSNLDPSLTQTDKTSENNSMKVFNLEKKDLEITYFVTSRTQTVIKQLQSTKISWQKSNFQGGFFCVWKPPNVDEESM